MVSSNNVTITEHENGDLTVTCFDGVPPWHELDAVEAAAVEAHYRAKFAAARMPEDVQKLVDEARGIARSLRAFQPRPGEWASGGVHDNDRKAGIVDALADALEAAYSQKGKAHEGA